MSKIPEWRKLYLQMIIIPSELNYNFYITRQACSISLELPSMRILPYNFMYQFHLLHFNSHIFKIYNRLSIFILAYSTANLTNDYVSLWNYKYFCVLGIFEEYEKCKQNFMQKTWRKRDDLEDLSINGQHNNKFDLNEEGVDWIHLSQYRVL